MPYNPYTPYGYPQYPQQPINPEPPKQIQYSVVNAPSVDYARSYPVAPGNSISFKIENQPFLCTKSMGFSPLEKPVFETYRLVKEDDVEIVESKPEYALKDDIKGLEERISELENSVKPTRRKKEAEKEAENE